MPPGDASIRTQQVTFIGVEGGGGWGQYKLIPSKLPFFVKGLCIKDASHPGFVSLADYAQNTFGSYGCRCQQVPLKGIAIKKKAIENSKETVVPI